MQQAREQRGWEWAILGLLLAPIWLAGWLPTTDFTNHLARCWVLFHLPWDPFWANLYGIGGAISPNTAIDLIAPQLFSFFPVELTGRLIFSLVVVLHWIAIRSLGRAAGTWNWLALPTLFFVQNSVLYMGFLNYCLSLSLWLLILALWRRKQDSKWKLGDAAALTALGAAVYISHLRGMFCLGVSALWMAGWALWHGRRDWRLVLYALPVLPGALTYLILPPPKLNPMPPIIFDGIRAKLIKSMALFSGYDYVAAT